MFLDYVQKALRSDYNHQTNSHLRDIFLCTGLEKVLSQRTTPQKAMGQLHSTFPSLTAICLLCKQN